MAVLFPRWWFLNCSCCCSVSKSRQTLQLRGLQMPGAPCPSLSLRRISMNTLCLYLYSFHFILNEHLLQGACGFPCSAWKRPMSTTGEASQEAPCLGSLLFSQPALLLVLPAGLQELAFTCLNLDMSSMETYMYIHILSSPCLRRAVFCCTNTDDCQQPVGTQRVTTHRYATLQQETGHWDREVFPVFV